MTSAAEHVDILLIGSGSGNSFPGPEFANRTIAFVDRGVSPRRVFGGTCLNVGCIPTKMFVHTADVASAPEEAPKLGVDLPDSAVDFPAVRDRVFGRIDAISRGGQEYRADHEDNENLTLVRGTARFTGPKAVTVDLNDGGQRAFTADTVIIGAGSRPMIPDVPGLRDLDPLTSDTIMRIEQLPESIAVLGTGVIALEFAHILRSFGVEVHLIARSDLVLRSYDRDIAERITEVSRERCTLHTNTSITAARREADGSVHLTLDEDGESTHLQVGDILVATGRVPNSDLLDARAGGLGVDENGVITVDPFQRVLDPKGRVLEGVWSFGDVSSPVQLKHVANHQQRTMRHNILHPDDLRRADEMPVPAAVFTHPQIATVGMTEQQARDWSERSGREIRVAVQKFSDIAYGWAMENEGDFLKLIVDAASTEVLGAHIIGPQAPTLIQQFIQAMSLGITARDMARHQYWIHPAMPELVENALLQTFSEDD